MRKLLAFVPPPLLFVAPLLLGLRLHALHPLTFVPVAAAAAATIAGWLGVVVGALTVMSAAGLFLPVANDDRAPRPRAVPRRDRSVRMVAQPDVRRADDDLRRGLGARRLGVVDAPAAGPGRDHALDHDPDGGAEHGGDVRFSVPRLRRQGPPLALTALPSLREDKEDAAGIPDAHDGRVPGQLGGRRVLGRLTTCDEQESQ